MQTQPAEPTASGPALKLSPLAALRTIRAVTADLRLTPAIRNVIIAIIANANGATGQSWATYNGLRMQTGASRDTVNAALKPFGDPDVRMKPSERGGEGMYFRTVRIGKQGAKCVQIIPDELGENRSGEQTGPVSRPVRLAYRNRSGEQTDIGLLSGPICAESESAAAEVSAMLDRDAGGDAKTRALLDQLAAGNTERLELACAELDLKEASGSPARNRVGLLITWLRDGWTPSEEARKKVSDAQQERIELLICEAWYAGLPAATRRAIHQGLVDEAEERHSKPDYLKPLEGNKPLHGEALRTACRGLRFNAPYWASRMHVDGEHLAGLHRMWPKPPAPQADAAARRHDAIKPRNSGKQSPPSLLDLAGGGKADGAEPVSEQTADRRRAAG